MSDINLKALRDLTEMTVAASASHQMSMPAGRLLQILDRLESAERRAEEAEKECAEQARLAASSVEREVSLAARHIKRESSLLVQLGAEERRRQESERGAVEMLIAVVNAAGGKVTLAPEAKVRVKGFVLNRFDSPSTFETLFWTEAMAQEGGK